MSGTPRKSRALTYCLSCARFESTETVIISDAYFHLCSRNRGLKKMADGKAPSFQVAAFFSALPLLLSVNNAALDRECQEDNSDCFL